MEKILKIKSILILIIKSLKEKNKQLMTEGCVLFTTWL